MIKAWWTQSWMYTKESHENLEYMAFEKAKNVFTVSRGVAMQLTGMATDLLT